MLVALYARAWVEMRLTVLSLTWAACRPLREGVGRNPGSVGKVMLCTVALYARAWVEISEFCQNLPLARVALYARAWVEMVLVRPSVCLAMSPSTRGRG